MYRQSLIFLPTTKRDCRGKVGRINDDRGKDVVQEGMGVVHVVINSLCKFYTRAFIARQGLLKLNYSKEGLLILKYSIC